MPRSFSHVLLLLLTCTISIKAGEQIEGLFSDNLTNPGYYLVTTIPEGATSINVTEVPPSHNFLAVRVHDGTYIFNGYYDISVSRKFSAVGTNIIYLRHNGYYPETFYSPGPLNASVDVMLVYHKFTPRVSYRYTLPTEFKMSTGMENDIVSTRSLGVEQTTKQFASTNSENVMLRDEIRSSTALPRRKRKRKFLWRPAGFTKCSKPCGGGFQSKRYICIAIGKRNQTDIQSKRHVASNMCRFLKEPKVVTVRCNSNPCAPQWKGGQWSKCSVSCGNGTRTRNLQCIQEKPDNLNVRVEDHECPREPMPAIPLEEICYMPDCNIYTTPKTSVTTKQYSASPRWRAEEWSPCSTTCGNGKRRRLVTCVTYGKACNTREKPATEQFCNMGSCETKSFMENEIPDALTNKLWLYSAWPEQCSAECGKGPISRRLYCESFLKNETCDETKTPIMNKTCVSSQTCGQWFIGPWTECSSSCDVGMQTREVVCVSRFLGALKVVKDINCPNDVPEKIQVCVGPSCNATWFMSDWTQCSKSCGGGTQKRVVKCIGPDGVPISDSTMECDDEKRPVNKRNCNEIPCNRSNHEENNSLAITTESDNLVETECRDTLSNCWMLRNKTKESKRRCHMEPFKRGCCKACRYYSFLSANA